MRIVALAALAVVSFAVGCGAFKDPEPTAASDAAADDSPGGGGGGDDGSAGGGDGGNAGGDDAGGARDGATHGDAAGAAGTNGTKCAGSGVAGCSCAAPDPSKPGSGNAYACDGNVGIGAVCCAGAGWPSTGSTCTCFTATCNRPGGGGCDCSLGFAGDTCNDGTACCVSPFGGQCECTFQGSTCPMDYRQVTQCDGLAIGCGNDRRVTSCTIP